MTEERLRKEKNGVKNETNETNMIEKRLKNEKNGLKNKTKETKNDSRKTKKGEMTKKREKRIGE